MGLQREATPQPEPKTFQVGENSDREEEQAGPQNGPEGVSSKNVIYSETCVYDKY